MLRGTWISSGSELESYLEQPQCWYLPLFFQYRVPQRNTSLLLLYFAASSCHGLCFEQKGTFVASFPCFASHKVSPEKENSQDVNCTIWEEKRTFLWGVPIPISHHFWCVSIQEVKEGENGGSGNSASIGIYVGTLLTKWHGAINRTSAFSLERKLPKIQTFNNL